MVPEFGACDPFPSECLAGVCQHGPMTSTTRLLLVVPLLIAAAACGSDGDSSSEPVSDATAVDDSVTADVTTGPDDASSESDTEPATTESDNEPAPPPSGGGGATLTLANGETYEFATVLCTLEPQMAAGSEILFTATSYDDPGLDITQFGDDGTITGVASISVYDGDFETLWEANTMFGSTVELTLDGSTIRGTASFIEGGDISNEAVDGEVVANC